MPASLSEALRYYQGDVSNNPEFNAYWQMFGDPPDDQSWWIGPDGQLTPQAQQWFATAQASGDAEAQRQAAADDDGLLGLGPIGDMAALAAGGYFLGPLIGSAFSGAGAATGAAGAGLGDAALGGFYGGLGEGALSAGAGLAGAGLGDASLGSFYGDLGLGTSLPSAAGGFPLGTEGDWWTGMPTGSTEAAAGGGGGSTSLWNMLTNSLKGGSGSSGSTDWLGMLGKAAPGLISAYASGQQGNAIKDIAGQQQAQFDKYFNMGQPYRDRLSALYSDPSKFLSSPEVQVPVQQGTDALARSLSARVGNPIDNMTALGELQNYASNNLFGRLGQEKDRLAGFGGLSAYNQAGASGNTLQAQLMGANADAGIWGGLGRAAGDVFNPAPMTLTDLLKQMQGNNIFGTR